MRAGFFAALTGIAFFSAIHPAAQAQAWPSRGLKIVVPFAAGGSTDVFARLVGDRLASALTLARRFACVAVLKGSGSVIASSEGPPFVNPTGNARLACAGTGDVLAGMVGARLAAGAPALDAALQGVFRHGQTADQWPAGQSLTALALAARAGGG